MKLCRSLLMVLVGGLIALPGCARTPPPPRVEVAPTDTAKPKATYVARGAPAETEDNVSLLPDKGTKLLRGLLQPPAELANDSESRSGPRPLPAPPEVAHPQPPASARQAALPRKSLTSKRKLLPHAPSEGTPLVDYRANPQPTTRTEFLGGAPIQLPSQDVSVPPRLPMLGLLTPDRVPLDSPTTEESGKAALAAVPPARTNPVSFVPRNLPDPFENAQTGRVRSVPAEDSTPSTGSVQLPKN